MQNLFSGIWKCFREEVDGFIFCPFLPFDVKNYDEGTFHFSFQSCRHPEFAKLKPIKSIQQKSFVFAFTFIWDFKKIGKTATKNNEKLKNNSISMSISGHLYLSTVLLLLETKEWEINFLFSFLSSGTLYEQVKGQNRGILWCFKVLLLRSWIILWKPYNIGPFLCN